MGSGSRFLQGELLSRARGLPQRQQVGPVESLDPDRSAYFGSSVSRGPGVAASGTARDLLAAFGGAILPWGLARGEPALIQIWRPVKLDPEPLQLLQGAGEGPRSSRWLTFPLDGPQPSWLRWGRQLWRQRLCCSLQPLKSRPATLRDRVLNALAELRAFAGCPIRPSISTPKPTRLAARRWIEVNG